MMKWLITVLLPLAVSGQQTKPDAWIRINQLGYLPGASKVAVWCSKANNLISDFQLVDAGTKKIVYTAPAGKSFGAYGPFSENCRLDFSSFKNPGHYYLQAGGARSPEFAISHEVYHGAADFCLRYMRQQRTGFNPFLKDSCHTRDGYVLYGEKAGIADSTFVDVVGGWHDASDYLQYASTSANATYHLLMAYRDFPEIFTDEKLANGLDGKNKIADVLDEAKWGLDWLLKMHPRDDWMFNQIADDRDHISMRIPKEDSQYGKENQRPVYFLSGEPQQRGKFLNQTTGTSSTAGKFCSAFALGSRLFEKSNPQYASLLLKKSRSAFSYANKKLGVSQTASVRAPYIYAEENWVDDMEQAAASLHAADPQYRSVDFGGLINLAFSYAKRQPVTPWLGSDTASHYQWYPFINLGHYELSRQLSDHRKDTLISFLRQGISQVWEKARSNAFYRGVPFIWCSNNLVVSFAILCTWYRQLSGDHSFLHLEQASIDWLFGCNPWGTSMVYGLPSWGDTPEDPHSAFTHLKNYAIDGGLVDGPVYTSIYENLIGIRLYRPDEYADFQSRLAVYHDDYGDYSTNEPTMDGTASLIYLLAAMESQAQKDLSLSAGSRAEDWFSFSRGGIIRGDSTLKRIALVFTGDEYADGADFILKTLEKERARASFFLTGNFYRNKSFRSHIRRMKKGGHYLGAHSNRHLLYCDWNNRDSLLVTRQEFLDDLAANYEEMAKKGILKSQSNYFLPPFEWYNDSIATWTKESGLILVNYSPGTRSHADYTWPQLENYINSPTILESIKQFEHTNPSGLNGFILLMHIGTDPRRTDKFYKSLPALIRYLKEKSYRLQTIEQLLHTEE